MVLTTTYCIIVGIGLCYFGLKYLNNKKYQNPKYLENKTKAEEFLEQTNNFNDYITSIQLQSWRSFLKIVFNSLSSGFMTKRKGKYGQFLGCTNYPEGCNTINIT